MCLSLSCETSKATDLIRSGRENPTAAEISKPLEVQHLMTAGPVAAAGCFVAQRNRTECLGESVGSFSSVSTGACADKRRKINSQNRGGIAVGATLHLKGHNFTFEEENISPQCVHL